MFDPVRSNVGGRIQVAEDVARTRPVERHATKLCLECAPQSGCHQTSSAFHVIVIRR